MINRSPEYLYSLWVQGNTLQAGELIYHAISVDRRAQWAKAVLDVCKERYEPVAEIEAVCAIAEIEEDWPKAYEAFSDVRRLTLECESRNYDDPIYAALLMVAENAAKVIYNASGHSAPFDKDCGDWLVVCARDMVELVNEQEFERRVWQALKSKL